MKFEGGFEHLAPDWLLSAETIDAVVEITEDGSVIWKSGIWVDGYWCNGIWKSGTWKSGVWKGGIVHNSTFPSGVWLDHR